MATDPLPSSCRRSVGLACLLLVLGALAYNNWALSSTLNPDLPAAAAFVSEYSVPSQPNSLIFRAMDAVSGALVLIAAIMVGIHRHLLRVSGCVTRYMAPPEGWSILAWLGTVLFALSTMADAAFPMTCALSILPPAEATAPPCVGPLASAHDVTSTLAGTGAIIALVATTVALVRYYGRSWHRRPMMWVLIVCAGAHVSGAVYTFVGALVPGLAVMGYVQRLSIAALSLWTILLVLSPTGRGFLQGRHRVDSQSLSHVLKRAASPLSASPEPSRV
ncbi:DUF998 domain-containing protein [Schaalia sp. Marseille-Q2122]|uniref:DUF998 domain-containing protein n=1 Tax=Schaalia sp. Marseille-Q2122 TaxID=2736604 RepID=UPI00158E9336|nr:DUF998 domain-containing protein [Schaalia sp. Marseille-Q2122]